MSGSKDRNQLNNTGSAFEYVAGTLSPEEKSAFKQLMESNEQLRSEVSFWEEHFMALQDRNAKLPPKRDTWTAIAARINAVKTEPHTGWQHPGWRWLVPGTATIVLLATIILVWKPIDATMPNTDYVAVLTDAEGDARLTALTTGDNQTMWLQWNEVTLREGGAVQLWAVSRRDGQTRSIAVFNHRDIALLSVQPSPQPSAQLSQSQLSLSQASWRLIKDAEKLLLTEEEAGGSPIDEPSDVVIATGICIRFDPQKQSG